MAMRLNCDPQPLTTPAGHRLDLAPLEQIPQLAHLVNPDDLALHATTRGFATFLDYAGRVCVAIDDAYAIRAALVREDEERAAARAGRLRATYAEDAQQQRSFAERQAAMQRRAELQQALDSLPSNAAHGEAWEAWERHADELAQALFAPDFAPDPDPLAGLGPVERLKARERGEG